MSRRYSDEDRARAYVVYTANGGNVKRSARDTGLPEGTLRGWMRDWDENGPPLEMVEKIANFAGEFVEDASRIRDLALSELEVQIRRGEVKAAQLVATVGMLQDKINMAKGLATSRTETVHALPPAEEIADALGTALQAALHAAQMRDGEIIDAEITALSASK
jgi:transposase-like protein